MNCSHFVIFEDIIQSIENVDITQETLTFSAPVFRFAWNGWNFMNGISSGKVNAVISRNENNEKTLKFKYSIFFTEFFVIALAFTSVPAFFYKYPEVVIAVSAMIWIGFYLGSLIIFTSRFNRRFIKITRKTEKELE